MAVLYKNNAASSLASGINTTATSIVLVSGGGAKFPAPTGSDFFYLTILDGSGNFEIVKVTVRTTDTLTVVRAQEGTTALSFSSGVLCELRITGGLLDQFKTDTASGITSSNVTNALGFTPYNASNPSGYITGITSSNVTTALGFTPYNATNPSGYLTGITSTQVTTALGYTPYNSSNPSGYITGITSGMVTTALGFTPYNNSNPSGYITSAALSPYLTTASAASTYLALSGGTIAGQLNVNNAGSATAVMRLWSAGSTIWSVGVGDSSGTNFNISADFGSLLVNKSSGNVTTPGQFYAGSSNLVLHLGNKDNYTYPPASHDHSRIGWTGTRTAESGTTNSTPSGFFEMVGAYNNGWPATYGNVLSANGGGAGQLYMGWIGGSGAETGELYYRSMTDWRTNWGSWRRIITDANYNSYSPTLTGTGASGTWGISISGNAATATNGLVSTGSYANPSWITSLDASKLTGTLDNARVNGGTYTINITGNAGSATSATGANQLNSDTSSKGSALQYWQLYGNSTLNPNGDWHWAIRMSHGDAETYYSATLAIPFGSDALYFRRKTNGTNQSWISVLNSANYNSYSPTLTGTGASGTWAINITGSAATATDNTKLPLAGGTLTGTTYINTGGGYPLQLSSSQRYMLQLRNTGNSINSGYGWWFATDTNFNFAMHADGLGDVLTLTRAGALTLNGNTVLHAGNYTSYANAKGGGWYGSGLPGSRWGGYSVSSGEISFGDGLPNANQMGILIDGCYVAGENNGFWSMGSDNSWGSRRGMYWDGSYLNFTTNTPTARFQGILSDGRANIFDEVVKQYLYVRHIEGKDWDTYSTGASGLYLNYASNQNVYIGSGSNIALHAGNYNSYSPTLTGGNASGTWGINITGNAATAGKTNANSGYARVGYGMAPFYNWGGTNAGAGAPSDSTYTTGIDVGSHPSDQAYGFQIASNMWNVGLWTRTYNSGFSGWVRILDSSNYNSYSPSLTGGNASGTWGINVTGTAGSISGYNNPTTAATANTIAYRDGAGDIAVREIVLTVGVQDFTPSSLVAIYPTTNQGVKVTAGGARNFLDVPTRGGGNASGTWGISITGSAPWGSVTGRPDWLNGGSYIETHSNANDWKNSGFYENGGGGSNWPSATWYNSINVRHSNTGNYHGFQVAMSYYDNNLWFRSYQGGGTFQSWAVALSSQNYSSYAVPQSDVAENGASKVLRTASNGYLYINNWINVASGGIYSSVNSAHFTPNTGSYGAWQVNGSRDGWRGINFDNSVVLMMNDNESGNHKNGYGWQFRWNNGTMYCHKNSYGGGTSATMLDSSNFGSYAINRGGDTIGSIIYYLSNRNTTSDSCPLQAYSNNGSGATMSFHRGGYYAVNFGLDSDNVMRIGGWSAAANRWQLDMSGNVTYAGNVTAYSDERLKKDWAPVASDFVASLAKIKSGTYTRIDSEERQAGVSAQDFQNLLPETVSEDNEGTLSIAYGNAALVSAVELAKDNVELRARIERLETLINKLIGD